jgi:cysteinyl-tRNA synthetase
MRLFDTKTQSLQEVQPIQPGRLGVYVCGPTVQSAPHIGHLRSALIYDILRRWMTYSGLHVTLVRNVTDIDDKILANAQTTGEPWWALAYRVERDFNRAYDALGILPPTYEPRATGTIERIQLLIELLIEHGHAYRADDDSGDVYFDTASWQRYGELTHQRVEDMVSDDASERGKRASIDFALWKGRKDGEPESASWPSPWGRGRPGWHIECSAMSTLYLGGAFDIHGGGLDLRFPHHENELAQTAAAGYEGPRIWMHNGLVSVGGQKMSKSLGNSVFASELLDEADPATLRYFLGAAHYRSTLEYSPQLLGEARAAVGRIRTFLTRAAAALRAADVDLDDGGVAGSLVPIQFAQAMDDDLGVPQALAVLHDAVHRGNGLFDDAEGLAGVYRSVTAMLAVLGIDLASDAASADSIPLRTALDALVPALLDERQQARAAHDYARADQLRDRLVDAGIAVEDTPDGAKWRIDG